MFWSDLGPKVGYEAIGIIDSTLPTVSVFAKLNTDESKSDKDAAKDNINSTVTTKPTESTKTADAKSTKDLDDFGKGIVFYLKDDKIVGIVLWNVFNRINTARAVISYEKRFDDLNEVAKLFDIHT